MNHAESFEQPAAQAFQKVIHIPIRPALHLMLDELANYFVVLEKQTA